VRLGPGVALVGALASGGLYCLGVGDCTLRSADRIAYRAFAQQDYPTATSRFVDPQWRAAALYRRGEFEQAAAIWSGADTAEGLFNHGNALLLQGQYAAAAQRFGLALERRPGWGAAQENREIALSRAAALEQSGGEMTGGMLGADDIAFAPPSSGNDDGANDPTPAEVTGAGDAALREIWLRQVQTRPADFLRSKFAYQYATRAAGGAD